MSLRLVLPVLLALAASAQTPPPPAAPKPSARPAAAGRGAAAGSYKDLKFGAMRVLEPAQPTRVQLSNGMKVLMLEDHETPLVTAVAVIRTGSVLDPPDRAGLATVTGALIRGSGAYRRTPDRLDADLETIGATIESSIGESMGTVTLSALRESLAEALPIFRDLLTEPSFRQDRIDYYKATLGQAILRRNDDPRELLRREFRALVFGRDNPAVRRAEYATVARIGRGDVTGFYKRYFFPANIMLTIAGDFDAAQMKETLETLFGSWKEQQPPVELPKTEPKSGGGGYVAIKPELRETHIAVGQIGGAYDDRDAAALEVAAAVLGLGPQSRLVRRARDAQGSIREIRAEWLAGFGRPGIFVATASGVSIATGQTVAAILDEIRKLRSAEVTDDEIRAARDFVIMRLLNGFDSKPRALAAIANLEYHGYTIESIQQLQKAVAAVTRADVLRVVKERLDPDKMTVLAVSNLSVFDKPLDPRGGPSIPVDLVIPPPTAGATAPTAASSELGKALLQRAQQASGGAEKLAAVKDYSQTATYANENGGRETQTDRWIAPSTIRQDMQSSQIGTLVRFCDGQSGWASNGRNSAALTGLGLRQAREELLRAYIPMLLSDRLPGRTVVALDEQTVEISQGDLTARVVFDPQTGLPSKLLYDLQIDRQPTLFVEEEYSDFRDVAGIKAPFAITVRRNGIKHADAAVSDFKINSGIKVEVLQRRP